MHTSGSVCRVGEQDIVRFLQAGVDSEERRGKSAQLSREERAEVEMKAMEIEGARERSPEATGKCADMKGTRHMDAAARDGNVTEMLSKIRTNLLEGANGVDNDADAMRELEAFFRTYLQLVQSHPGIFRLLRSSEMRRCPSRVQIRIEYEGFFEWIRQAIATGVRNGSIRDDLEPRALALVLTGMLETLTTRWLLSDCACTLEESAAAAWDTFRILIAPSAGSRRADTATSQGVQ